MGVPSSARIPPCVLRMRISLPPSALGFHPIPAFWLHPNRSPDGRFSSISAVIGNDPWGPAAFERTSKIELSPESTIVSKEIRIRRLIVADSPEGVVTLPPADNLRCIRRL